jgi:large subunit ribosomal protein L4
MSDQKKSRANKQETSKVVTTISLQDVNIDASQKKTVSDKAFSVWVRSLLQNWRQGTVACKGRSDVAFSNKKPWKQKGTGRARAGSRRSPLWRGGGVMFGPQARVKTLQVPKNLKKNVLGALAFEYLEAGRVACLDWNVQGDLPKTAQAYLALKDSNLVNGRINLFLPIDDHITYASFTNIPNVQIFFFDQPNAYDLAKSNHWVFLKKDFDQFKEMVTKWI